MKISNDSWFSMPDKALHLVIGFLISLIVFAAYFFVFDLTKIQCAILSILISETINIVKELIDETGFSYKDIAWATVGNVVGIGIFFV